MTAITLHLRGSEAAGVVAASTSLLPPHRAARLACWEGLALVREDYRELQRGAEMLRSVGGFDDEGHVLDVKLRGVEAAALVEEAGHHPWLSRHHVGRVAVALGVERLTEQPERYHAGLTDMRAAAAAWRNRRAGAPDYSQ